MNKWLCRIRMCTNWTEPHVVDGVFKYRKAKRSEEVFHLIAKNCVDCGRQIISGWTPAKDTSCTTAP